MILRGVAALAVVLSHFGRMFTNDPKFGDLFAFFRDYGRYGVQMFFVISGFVIPLSLDQAHYKLTSYAAFLKKRAYRLHPPYIAALILTLVLSYLSYKATGQVYEENAISITKSFFYLHFPKSNPVFWTLGVEVIYYLFIGLFFPVFKKYPALAAIVILPLLIVLSQTTLVGYVKFFNYTLYFLVGIFGYFIYSKQKLLFNAVGLAASLTALFYFKELPSAFIALLTILFIFFYKYKVPKPLNFLGEISYSVYLIHFVFGIKLINLLARYISPSYCWALLIAAILFVYAVSYVFYLLIEIPSANLSNKVKYKKSVETVIDRQTL